MAVADPAAAADPGGAEAPGTRGGAGGVEYGSPVRGAQPPQATRFSVTPHTTTAGGRPPSIVLRVDEPGVRRVTARIVFWPAHGSDAAIVRIPLGTVRTGRTIRVAWPKGAALAAGRYTVRLHAADQGGLQLRRSRSAPGRRVLTVKPKPKPKPKPTPAPTPAPLAPPSVQAPPATAGGVFPVRGAFTYGDGFGVGRVGHTHQGVDVLAPQGTPIVAPTAGTIRFTDYQASAAGEYLVERLADGRDIFLAHCVRHSTAVVAGQAVAAGTRLCDLGATGDASGPHLHFELWPDGWRDVKKTVPVDPLPQLKAWAR
ncbi:MAG: family metallopeptidase [Solirubrobacterales bacterium]|nr:family metallopeptidase [Solirubrobacterales bacterium]